MSSTLCCMGFALLPMPVELRLANDYEWTGVVFVAWLVAVWIGGTVLLQSHLFRLWNRGRKGAVLGLVPVQWAVTLGCFAVVVACAPDDYRFGKAMNPHAAEYWNLAETGEPAAGAHARGKCVFVKLQYEYVDSRHVQIPAIDSYYQAQLPSAIRAENDGEVRTIVRLVYSTEPVPNTKDGKIDTCEVTLLDRQTGQRIGHRTFRGEWRQVRTKQKGMVWVGHLDAKGIVEWVRSLPREP